jgi:hypothetical protein
MAWLKMKYGEGNVVVRQIYSGGSHRGSYVNMYSDLAHDKIMLYG